MQRIKLWSSSVLMVTLLMSMLMIPKAALGFWSVEIAGGGAYNIPTPLTIQQMGEPDINLTARYDNKSFEAPFYYVIRIGKWEDNVAWEIETIHHKLYLSNTTDEVEAFSISDGYNVFTLNRAWLKENDWIWRLGAGLIVSHPESTIRGQKFDEKGGTLNDWGFYVAGPVVMGSVGKRFYVTKSFFIEIEGKVTAAYADVPVVNGSAYVPNLAVHANVGIGFDLFKS